jgi:hypothetical protein
MAADAQIDRSVQMDWVVAKICGNKLKYIPAL